MTSTLSRENMARATEEDIVEPQRMTADPGSFRRMIMVAHCSNLFVLGYETR